MSFRDQTTENLLRHHVAIADELRRRELIRTANNFAGDLAETIVQRIYGGDKQGNSNHGFDLICSNGHRYEIKARRLDKSSDQAWLSPIRKLDQQRFEYLAVVVFDREFQVLRAARMSHALFAELAVYKKHVNGHVLVLSESVLSNDGVEDLTEKARQKMTEL